MSKYENLFDANAFKEERPKELREYDEPVEELEELLTDFIETLNEENNTEGL